MVRNLRPGLDWISGVIIERLGPVTYLVDVNNGQVWKRHADQLKSLSEKSCSSEETTSDFDADHASNTFCREAVPARTSSPEPEEIYMPVPQTNPEQLGPAGEVPLVPPAAPPEHSNSSPERRYPSRVYPPDRFS